MIERKQLRFDIPHDPGNRVAETYGLKWVMPEDLQQIYLQLGLDVPAANGDQSWSLPVPARYIIDQQRIVRYARFDPDYTHRPEPAETLEHLRHVVHDRGA